MAKKPNILLITTDQQRYDTIGKHAPAFMRTPHTDYLMREGITFEKCYAQTPACVPSRLSIMTGHSPQALKVYGNTVTTGKITPETKTLPRVMNDLGYHTVAIGKMHFEPERARYGFSEMIIPRDYYNKIKASGSPLQPMKHGMGQNEMYPTLATVPETQTLTSFITEECVEYLENRRDPEVPFFMWCSYSKPHPPLDPPEPYYSMYRNENIEKAKVGEWAKEENAPTSFNRFRQRWSTDLLPEGIIKEAKSAYYGLITQCDYNMGRIFSALQDIGELNNTWIIFASDHGEFLGDHMAAGKFFGYEQSIHVPLVIRPPKEFSEEFAGRTSDKLVSLMDLLPTIAGFTGNEVKNANFEGIDLIDMVRRDKEREYLTGIYFGDGDYFYILNKKYKYIYYPEDGVEQLFDIENDREDMVDLSKNANFSGVLTELKCELIKYHEETGSEFVNNGEFVPLEKKNDTTAQRRANSWPGYHTEYTKHDVLH